MEFETFNTYISNFDDADEILGLFYEDYLNMLDNICKHNNVQYVDELGGGRFGKAYLLNDNTVLKITTSPEEAKIAYKLKNKESIHLTNIYNVGKYYINREALTYYWIIMEYTPICNNEFTKIVQYLQEEFDNWFNNTFRKYFGRNIKNEYDKNNYLSHGSVQSPDFVLNITTKNKDFLELFYYNYVTQYKDNNHVYYEYRSSFFVEYLEMLNEILKIDNALPDLHWGNLGQKPNGSLCAFDIMGVTFGDYSESNTYFNSNTIIESFKKRF